MKTSAKISSNNSISTFSLMDFEEIQDPSTRPKNKQFWKACNELFDSKEVTFNKFFAMPIESDMHIQVPKYHPQTQYTFLQNDEKNKLQAGIKFLKNLSFENSLLREIQENLEIKQIGILPQSRKIIKGTADKPKVRFRRNNQELNTIALTWRSQILSQDNLLNI